MNWNDLLPEAKIYIELSPVEFAKILWPLLSLYWKKPIAQKSMSVLSLIALTC